MFKLLVRITSKSPTLPLLILPLLRLLTLILPLFLRLLSPCVGLSLVIPTSSINILVIYLLVLLAIYLQIDIYPRFIYKLILFLNWV